MKLYDTTQFKQTYRRIPPVMIDEVPTHIQELIAIGVCCVPHSPFSSKKVLFRKQDELLRLSELTIVNLIQGRLRITVPKNIYIRSQTLSLSGNIFFPVLKLWVFPDRDRRVTQGQNCVYSGDTWILRVRSGQCSSDLSASTVEVSKRSALEDMFYLFRQPDYLFNDYKEHLDRLRQIFDRIRKCGLRPLLKKCSFFMNKSSCMYRLSDIGTS